MFSIERVAPLLERARETIQRLEARNISLLLGDGTLGWREYAPYDAILVSAASPEIPAAYLEQLVEGGRLLIPLGSRGAQTLHLMTRRGDSFEDREIGPVRFVPLVGRHGWEEE